LDPVTHLLTGACMARTGLNRTSGLTTAVLTIAAEFPDIDVVINLLAGPVAGFQHHRGITHSFIAVPFNAAVVLLAVWAWGKWRKPKPPPARAADDDHIPPPPPRAPRWWLLFVYGCIGSLSHILLDYTTAYGVRPFEPFSWRWYHWDIVSIVEPLLLLALAAGLALPWLFGLIQEEIGARRSRGRVAAAVALSFMVALWGVRDFYHRRAVIALSTLTYENEDPVRASAFPYEFTPFAWHGVVETPSLMETMRVDTLASEVDPQRRARVYYKPEETPVTLAAKATQFGRVFLDWADYPYVTPQQLPDGGWSVRFIDLRYAYPERRTPPLAGTQLLDKNLQDAGTVFGSIFTRRVPPAVK
jgi:inner membrane protein